MRVKATTGRKGNVVAFVDGVLCLFDKTRSQPAIGDELEVMICKTLGMVPDRNDPEKMVIPALIVRPIDDDAILIEHDGFECAGSMCRTTASLSKSSGPLVLRATGRTIGLLTPGWTPVDHVFNVNARFEGRAPTPPKPGRAYLSRADVMAHLNRIVGVPEISALEPSVVALLARRPGTKRAA